MKAVLLVGGYGTRLFPLTLRLSKCLLPLAGKPVLLHTIELLKGAGINDLVISLRKGQSEIEKYFGDGGEIGVDIVYVYEETTSDEDKLGSVGAMNYVLDQIQLRDECLFFGGDNFAHELNIKDLIDHHRGMEAAVTIALYELREKELVRQYGVAQIDEKRRIQRFQEKPRVEEAFSFLAATAIYCLSGKFTERYLPEYIEAVRAAGKKPDMIGELWEHLVKRIPIYGYVFSGMWSDIGNVKTYIQTNSATLKHIPEQIESSRIAPTACLRGPNIRIERDTPIGTGVLIQGPVFIDAGCKVEERCIIGPSVSLAEECKIERGSTIKKSILFEGIEVGKNTMIENCVIDKETRIGDGCCLSGNSIIGYGVTVGDQVRIDNDSKIWPRTNIEDGSIIVRKKITS